MKSIANLNKTTRIHTQMNGSSVNTVLAALVLLFMAAGLSSTFVNAPILGGDNVRSTAKQEFKLGYSSRFMRINDYLFNGAETKTAIA